MKKMIAKITVAVMCLLVCSSPAMPGQFKVTTVYDGDTIMAEGHDIVIYVLLAGIDAPEIGSRNHKQNQPFGQEAKRYLENTILNKIVEIKGYGIGPLPYNHLIGEIFLGDRNINIELLKEGLAEVWREPPPRELVIAPYIEAEKEAKGDARGIWSLGDKYMSPRDWRNIHRKR